MTDARTLPEHTHNVTDYSYGPNCPACMALGRINPDTGTPWPALDDHGEQVVEEARERFSNRYDGTNHDAALEQAVTEAYQRGRMRGRLEERADVKARAERHERDAAEETAAALRSLDGSAATARAALSTALWHATAAQALRAAVGSR